jgi:hypothetical protein
MNQIRVGRLMLAGLATLIMWVAVEIVVEGMVAQALFGHVLRDQWLQKTGSQEWTALNYVVQMLLAVANSTLLVWLYASLRPMYGVGTKTALITSALVVTWVFLITINGINVGLFPQQAGLVEAVCEAIECPIALLAGAAIYEGQEKADDDRFEQI